MGNMRSVYQIVIGYWQSVYIYIQYNLIRTKEYLSKRTSSVYKQVVTI